ncbi:MAG: sigma-54 dependent transcriptional regulator [Thermoanaerobaculia bacterium]|nr:sigma-54 dependent transcriptional regulator [Thermoanaerobaculia bacterium]
MARILLVEDEPSLQLALGDTLADEGYSPVVAGTVSAALAELDAAAFDLVLCDLRLPDGDGMTVLAQARRQVPEIPVIVLTAYGTVQNAVDAIRAGASEYLTKPFEEQQLLALVRRYLEIGELRKRVQELEGTTPRPAGCDPEFLRLVEMARTVAASETTVLILGETGTGKEVFARFIHASSARRKKPFLAVNCAALPEALLESELFGHERGAFTGAVKQRRGRFEEANGGTLFLDEIAEASLAVQAKLLRALEQQCFERLGSNQLISVDVRILAATKRNLAAEVEAGRFRDDLFYRLNVVPLSIPPLRQRKGDIEFLAQRFAQRFGTERNRPLVLSQEALRCLSRHPFPGNVRELHHLVQRLAVLTPGEVVSPADLPDELRSSTATESAPAGERFTGTLAEILHGFEGQVLRDTLRRFDGHRARAAEALGISRKNLWEKLKAHGVDEE